MMLSVPPLVKLPHTSASPCRWLAAMATRSFSSWRALGKTVGSRAFSVMYIVNACLMTSSASWPGS
jgi:hypothetical protein